MFGSPRPVTITTRSAVLQSARNHLRRTYYDELGVAQDATPDQIQDAYFALARRYHPDLNRRPDANERMARINLAYETLSDPDRRARYDLEIGMATSPLSGQTPEPTERESRRSDRGATAGSGASPLGRSMPRWIIGAAVLILGVTTVVFVSNGGPLFNDWTFSTPCSGGCPTAIEQCYLDYGSYTRGWPPQTDAAVKQQFDECLLAAKETPAPTNP